MRNAFIDELMTLAAHDQSIALIVGDLGYSVIEPFADTYPDRFINAGVAEQNMMGLAAGMASEGYHPFVYSIANFPTFRCAEQIRNDIAYHQLSVTIVSVGGGLAYGSLGYSHHAVQDYALMRTLPHMLIAAPGDPLEVRACMRYLVTHPQPSYLRLGKAGEPELHRGVPILEPGQWLPVHVPPGACRTLLSTGATAERARHWCDGVLAGHALYTMPLWGMDSKACQPAQVANWQEIITVEDHLNDAGFGSWLMESLDAEPALRMRLSRKALDARVCGMVGSQAALNRLGGLEP